MASEKEVGLIVTWFEHRNYGYIQRDTTSGRSDVPDLFFHRRAVISGIPARGLTVKFVPSTFQGKPCALEVEVQS